MNKAVSAICDIDPLVTHHIDAMARAIDWLEQVQEHIAQDHSSEALKNICWQLWFLSEETKKIYEDLRRVNEKT